MIDHNEFSGELFRAVAVERSYTEISHNKISTDYSGPIVLSSRAIELRPDFLAGSTSNHLVSHNKVEDKGLSVFNWGIRARGDLIWAGYPAGPVLDYIVEHNEVKGATSIGIEAVGNSSSTSQVVEKNKVEDCGDGIYVEDYTTVEGNHVKDSVNDGLRVANNNNVVKNDIKNSGGFDLQINGTGNTFDKNKFNTCNSTGDLCRKHRR